MKRPSYVLRLLAVFGIVSMMLAGLVGTASAGQNPSGGDPAFWDGDTLIGFFGANESDDVNFDPFLDGAQVTAGLQYVRGEGMAQYVHARGLDDLSITYCASNRLLNSGIGNVMASLDCRTRVDRAMRGGKDILPRPFPIGVRILPCQRMGQIDAAETLAQIALVQKLHPIQLALQWIDKRFGQGRDAILLALAIADDQLLVLEINVLHTQTQGLQHTQTGAINQRDNQPGGAIELRQQTPHFLTAEHHRQARGFFCALQTVEPARARDLRRLFADNPVVVLTLVFIGLFVATDLVNRVQSGEAFLTPKQVSTTFLYAAILGLLAAGQTLVMLTGGVDLSVATTATTGAFMISSFATDGAAKAIAVALAVGLGIGVVNGVGVAIFRVNPLIMTLGVSTVTLGALTIYSQTRFLAPAPELVKKLGSERFFTYVPYGLLVWVPIAALIILGLRYSGFGRLIYAVGDNAVACRLAGVRTWQVLLAVYALCGLLSAAAGILLVGFNDAADLGIATPFLLPSVAAVVIGGTSIFGGVGGYAGTILGALILTVLDSLLTILNASQAARQTLYGLIILALAAIYARASAAD